MSGFDVTFRTQQMLAPYQMEAGRRQNEGLQYIGGAAAGAANQFNEMRLNAAQLMMRKAESDTRIAAWEQEQQLNQYKLNQMLALDQAMVSRHGVTMAQLQADEAKMLFEQRKSGFESETKLREAQYQKVMSEMFGSPEDAYARGWVPDESGVGYRRARSEDERSEFLRRIRSVADARRSAARPESQFSEARALEILREQLLEAQELGDQEQAQAIQERINSLLGIGQAGAAAPRGPQQGSAQGAPAKGAKRQPNMQIVQQTAQTMMESLDWSHDMLRPFTLRPEEQERLSMALGFLGESLVTHRGVRPEMAHLYVNKLLREDPLSMGLALLAGGYSDEQISVYVERVLGKTGKEKDTYLANIKEQAGKLGL